MRQKMSTSARKEVLDRLRPKYQKAGWKAKCALLDEFVELTGYCRKHAISLLNCASCEPPARGPGRPRFYDEAVVDALARVWRVSDCICGKRLVPFLPEMLCALERCGHLKLDEQVRSQLLCMSAATADRLLAPHRTEPKRSLSLTSPDRQLRKQITVRTHNDPPEPRPGYFEADLVAHCGSSARGQFLWSLVLTDIETGWMELVALADKSSQSVLEGIKRVVGRLPYAFLGLDTDNGSEFINHDVFDYCLEHGIGFTRSRPYKKNDQARVEERNGAVVRHVAGRDRFEGEEALGYLEALYDVAMPYQNCFQPMAKLVSKDRDRDSGHVTRRHDKALSPLRRTLGHERMSGEVKQALISMHDALDPVMLLAHRCQSQQRLWGCAVGLPRPEPAQEGITDEDLMRVLGGVRASNKVRPCHKLDPADPFAQMQDEIELALHKEPFLTAARLFEQFSAQYPDRFDQSTLRSLDRRVRAWRIKHGLSPTAKQAAGRPPAYAAGDGPAIRSFLAVWDHIGPILERNPYISAPRLLAILQTRFPATFESRQLTSMRRLLSAWRLEQSQTERTIGREG